MAVPIVPRATLVLGRRLPVRVEAATGMGEKSIDSVLIPLSLASLLIITRISPVRERSHYNWHATYRQRFAFSTITFALALLI